MTERIFSAPSLQNRTSIVDTYSRPRIEKPGKSALAGLAEALETANPQVQRYLSNKHDENVEQDRRDAQEARMKNKMSFAEGVKLYEKTGGDEGIDPGMSPYWRSAYKEMDGELSARHEYNSYVQQKYMESGLMAKEYATPMEEADAFNGFLDETRATFLENKGGFDNPDWLQGFEKHRPQLENMMSSKHLAERANVTEEKFKDSTGAYITSILDSNASIQEKAEIITQDSQVKLGQYGLSGTDYNKITVDSVTNRAIDYARMGRYDEAQEQLDVLDHVKTGTGTLGSTGYASDKRVDTELRIMNLQRSNEAYSWSLTQRSWAREDRQLKMEGLEIQERAKDVTQKAMADILADPTGDRNDLYIEMSQDKDLAPLIPKLQSFEEGRLNAAVKVTEDPVEVNQLRMDIMQGTADYSDILDMSANRELSVSTAASLMREAQDVQTTQDEISSMPSGVRGVVNDLSGAVKISIKGNEMTADPNISSKAEEAGIKSQIMFIDWYNEQETKPSVRQSLEESLKIRKLLAEQYGEGDAWGTPSQSSDTGIQIPQQN